MQQSLDVISVSFWSIVISLCNLLILFLLVKKFLYKPVRKMLSQRKEAIDEQYAQVDIALKEAEESRDNYENKLKKAKSEADFILKTASENADRRSDEIISDAKERAQSIVKRANEDAELEKRKAQQEIKGEIAEVSSLIAQKILSREINAEDHRNLISSFLDEIGDENGSNN